MKRLEIVYKQVAEISPYKRNPRKNDHAVNAVAESIKEFGFKVPIILDSKGEIIAGHTRLKAALLLKLQEVPCVVADDLTPEQIRAFRLADNKVGELAEWDFELLDLELGEIELDMSLFGFEEEIEQGEVVEDDFAEDVPDDPVSQLGDIWQLGNHRLMCGDSTSEQDVVRLMGVEKADMVFTDPPYNVAFNGRRGNFDVIQNDDLTEEDFNLFIGGFVDILNYLKPKHYYIWCNWKFYGILQQLLEFKACIVWAKNVFGLGKGYRHQHEFCLFNGNIDEDVTNESDLWQVKKDSNYVHPTQKPVELSARAIKNHKAVKNVVDLFGGSGSTLIACEQLNRSCYMMELDPRYCDVIINRWEKFTGKEAIRLASKTDEI